jgi:serine/threonine protein kinase/tetratricopeptide (TPR) repeat protein
MMHGHSFFRTVFQKPFREPTVNQNVELIDEIFWEAAQRPPGAARQSYLDWACLDDRAMRQNIERLLRAQPKVSAFLERPFATPAPHIDFSESFLLPNTRIGPYLLREQIGEGGMGLVFVADQEQPVRRRVALKVIKPGMDTRQVLARFEAERHALALMDHPNIAKVLDAGATESGRPYFVMELVRGVPITEYCDQAQLTTRSRVELFLLVSRAIQHAHQKGIIHRDIKPPNLLVTQYDTHPVPKVIDFGIAKAVGPTVADHSVYTGFAQLVGTPMYMSPEQAEMTAQDVDTRADVYALGVVLYELLTGTTPFDGETLRQAGFDEMRRIIREDEPAKPSHRVTTMSAEKQSALSGQRSGDGRQLGRHLRGDLDWVVMTALAKDRTRRYESAGAFAADLERYLADVPVEARPPSAAYRLRKFAQRNQGALAATLLLGFATLSVVGAIGWVVRDRSAREGEALQTQLTRQTQLMGQVQIVLAEADRLEREHQWLQALDTARRASDLIAGGDIDAEMAGRIQETTRWLELVRLVEDVRADKSEWKGNSFDYRGTAERYSAAFRDCGIDVDRMTTGEVADRLRDRPTLFPSLIPVFDDWVTCRRRTGDEGGAKTMLELAQLVDTDPWRQKVRTAVGAGDKDALIRLAAGPDLDRQPAATLTSLAIALGESRHLDVAVAVLSQARRRNPSDFWVHFELANAFSVKRPADLLQAVGSYRTAIGLRPRNAAAWTNLGNTLGELGQMAEAVECLNKAIALDPKLVNARNCLGRVLVRDKKVDAGIAEIRKAIDLNTKLAKSHVNLGAALIAQNQLDASLKSLNTAIDLDPTYAFARYFHGLVLAKQSKQEDAVAAFRKALELDPELDTVHLPLGEALLGQNKIDAAVTSLHAAVARYPANAVAYSQLGYALSRQKKYDEAIVCQQKAIALNPKLATAHNRLGSILCDQKKDYAAAEVAFRKVVELQPTVDVAHYNLGNALQFNGDGSGAIAAFREAVRLQPRNANAQVMLSRCLTNGADLALRNVRDGLQAAEKAVELTPQSYLAWLVAGWAHYRNGDWKASIAALEKSIALQKEPQGGYAGQWYFLAMAHWQLGDTAEARRWYNRAVTWMDKNTPVGDELQRIHAEAQTVLEIKKD